MSTEAEAQQTLTELPPRRKREPYADRVIRLPDPTHPRWVVFVSGRRAVDRNVVEPIVSFAYVGDRCAAEWCPPHGPIQLCRKATATDEGAEPHHIYEFIHPNGMAWSQCAVEDNGLPMAFAYGDTDSIFGVLRRWATRDESSEDRSDD